MIKFGTDGWRAVIGDEFTCENVRSVARAHARVLKKEGLTRVVVGYDRRFLSETFASETAKVMVDEGLNAMLSDEPCTTPMVSFWVKYHDFDGGVMITASHNPPQYNGYKIKEKFGGSATPSFIEKVEKELERVEGAPARKRKVERANLKKEYIKRVRDEINLELFRDRELVVVHDAMYGTSAGLLSDSLRDTGVSVVGIRQYRDALFGGKAPEPTGENLRLLSQKVRAIGANLGIANDGDGDRVAFVDERGEPVSPQLAYVLILLHLVKHRGVRDGVVVKTVSTTYLADRICQEEGLELREVPVGFKNINEVILREKVLFGGEESGGYGVPSFLPERDGLMASLLILEMIMLKDKPLSEIIGEVLRIYGESHYGRIDLPVEDRVKERLREMVENPPTSVGGWKVRDVITVDGLKLIFEDGAWLLLRASGTEPLVRVYGEAFSDGDLERILRSGMSLLGV